MFQRIILIVAALVASVQARDFEIEEFSKINGGWRGDAHVRRVGDVNGDGKADLIGFGDYGVGVALSTGTGFEHDGLWYAPGYTAQTGWNLVNHERRIADVNGDGKDDIVGFGHCVHVALSDGERFNYDGCWSSSFSSPAWNKAAHDERLVGDINNDGRADIVAFGHRGTWVAYSKDPADGNGVGFTAPQKVNSSYSQLSGWTNTAHVRRLADVNGDGADDIVGFGSSAVIVAYATPNGTTPFGHPTVELRNSFTPVYGWSVGRHVRELADVDGDGMADIVGFAESVVVVYLSTGTGFQSGGAWLHHDMTYAKHEWRGDDTPRLLGDVNGDGKADAIGFHWARTYARFSDGDKFVHATTTYAPVGTEMVTSLRPMHNNLCMYVHDTAGAPVVQGRCNPDAVSTVNWIIEGFEDGTAQIKTPNGHCLRSSGQGENATASIGACSDAPEVLWRIGRDVDGEALIQPSYNHQMCLGVPGATHDQGSILTVRHCDYYPNEIWRMETLHPRVVSGHLRTAAGSQTYGYFANFPAESLDVIDSAKGWHTFIEPSTGRCLTSEYTVNDTLWVTDSISHLSLEPCTGALAQRFPISPASGGFMLHVPQQPQVCFGAVDLFDTNSACGPGVSHISLTLASPQTDTTGVLKIHRVPVPGGTKTVLSIDSALRRVIVADPAAIAFILDRQGVHFSDAEEVMLFGEELPEPPAPGSAEEAGLVSRIFIENKAEGSVQGAWHDQPAWAEGDQWGPVSADVSVHNFTTFSQLNTEQVNANVGYTLIEANGAVGDANGTYVGAGVGAGFGLEGAASWGANDQYGFTVGLKFVTIRVYVTGDDVLEGAIWAATGIRTGYGEVVQGIDWIGNNVPGFFSDAGGTIVDTVHVVGTFFTDVGEGIADTATSLGNAIADGFCGIFGC